MSEFKGTPGPWQKNYDGPSLPIITNWAHGDEIVALVRTGEADASLIAAAPELLKACQELVAMTRYEDRRNGVDYSGTDEGETIAGRIIADADAAIAKALGNE